MKRLHYKLSAAMLAIVVVLGGSFYLVDRYSVRMYYEELSQRLNASLSMHIANSEDLISDGLIGYDALKSIASTAMIINPTAEIYLLDADGAILGHALPPEDIAVDRVDLEPVRALLSEAQALPIKGTNPRNPSAPKVFSAFPVTDAVTGLTPAGYLYIVLGGEQYDAVAMQVFASYKHRVVAVSILLLVLTAFLAGTSLFALLTRRLRRLTAEVALISSENFEASSNVDAVSSPRDEIDILQNACHSMVQRINEQIRSLQENDRLRRELVTNISHDLRTPLASMQGYIETLLIKDNELDAQTRNSYLEIARKHAAHLGKLVEDLFELAMLDADRVSPEFEEFSLLELIYDVVQEFELRARDAHIRLVVEPADDTVRVCADISLIQRVLENLVGNALKHTPAGGRVTISIRPSTDAVGISVTDTGRGIPADALPQVFDRFYKNEYDDVIGSESTGLGLAIAKRILELHGSEIRVVSELDRGTRFDFDLRLEAEAA